MSDTHRWGAMSFTQTPAVQTPNLETLAQQGISFSRYYVNLPICTPYRAILMTGRWPYQQGLMANHMSLAERVDLPANEQTNGTLSWVFKHAGYTTALIGKWHLGGRDARPFGFETSIVWGGTNNHRRSVYNINDGPTVQWKGQSNATAMTTQALDWIDEVRGAGKPFFLVLSLNPPHGPFGDALEEKQALYPDEAALPFHPLDDIRNWESHRDYHALISNVDDQVGRVMARLDELGLSEDTLLIYTSDHGGMTGIDGVGYGQKRHPNDESTRVPFLVRWPGHVPAGNSRQTLFSTIDVFPTLARVVGLQERLVKSNTPEAEASLTYLESLPGVDLSEALLNENGGPEPRSVFLMHPSNMNNNWR
ncbi:MAG: sulfatase-like hydrolase/transferase, partial [Verrucomicrobia bacterium]|nr:sulfatase-like hydrolase/transferase [Verrucomicrobiota bacterium]